MVLCCVILCDAVQCCVVLCVLCSVVGVHKRKEIDLISSMI